MSIVLDGTANTVTPLNGALGATTPSTVVATTVVASSTIKGATTIAVGNATPSASGAGITFPATQSASTDANTLDDYEEGTWTPSMGGTATYTTRVGTYVKIGKVVYIQGRIIMSSIGTGSTNQISGLPFASNGSDVECGISISDFGSIVSSVYSLCGQIYGSTLYTRGMNSFGTAISNFNVFGNSTYIEFGGTYTTNS